VKAVPPAKHFSPAVDQAAKEGKREKGPKNPKKKHIHGETLFSAKTAKGLDMAHRILFQEGWHRE